MERDEFVKILTAIKTQFDKEKEFTTFLYSTLGVKIIPQLTTQFTGDLLDILDGECHSCHYVQHWALKMDFGRIVILKDEKDFELKDIKTPEDLYNFIKSK